MNTILSCPTRQLCIENFGKSILLDELLKADDVEYTDVNQNRFWIVCPACNEAIFKVVRHEKNDDETALHYFSHYEARKAYTADCELRVGRITEREITQKAIQSRDQKLKFFINALQKIIHDDFERHLQDDPRWTANQFRLMKRSHTIADLRSLVYQFIFVTAFPKYTESELISTFDWAFQMLPQREQSELSTNLSLQTQNRIAVDLLRHLRTPQARPTFDTLFDHAFAGSARRLENTIHNKQLLGMPTRLDDKEEILKAMLQMLTTSRQKLQLILQKLGQTKFEATASPDSCDNYLMSFFDNIIREMFVILIRLPYLSLLRDALKKESPPERQTSVPPRPFHLLTHGDLA